MIVLGWIALICAAFPAILFVRNLQVFAPPSHADESTAVSILIPARDEELNIAAAIQCALANPNAEVIVLDDSSSDRTFEIVSDLAADKSRLRILRGGVLPEGWIGKNFACTQLAAAASHPFLLFVDADVRLAADATARLAAGVQETAADLISGVPRQVVGTFSEILLVPLIQFLLLGFLPLRRMRQSTQPAYATGCGQLIMVKRDAYERSGGHAAMRARIHDGLALPNQFRLAGFRTDLIDATDLAPCRMYRHNAEVWRGLTKNAHEGLGAPSRIVPITVLLVAGQVLPFALLATGSAWSLVAAILALLPRVLSMRRFQQPLASVILHPFAIAALVAIQWYALFRYLLGKPASWKGRSLTSNRMPLANAGEQVPQRIQHTVD
ncbi:MAG: glycosyltransferase [Verrucomicrobiota bacterium]|nr:glycosyltransferase [Verrucomicrobiota bacterium]